MYERCLPILTFSEEGVDFHYNIYIDAAFKPLHLYSVMVCRDESYLCRDESYFSFP